MKKVSIYIFSVVLLVTILSSCKKFLDLSPKDQRAVNSMEDVKSVLSGYLDSYAVRATVPAGGPVGGGPFPAFLSSQLVMFGAYADDIDFQKAFQDGVYLNSNNLHDTEKFYAENLIWNEYDAPEEIWNTYYGAVGFANTLIDQINEINTGDETERNQMLGELYTHRGFYLFKLLEYFAPYDQADMGIPVYLHTGGQTYGVPNPRLSQQEVYTIIINDLKTALSLLDKAPSRKGFNVWYTNLTINNILAQVYWFKAESAARAADDYGNAEKYSAAAIQGVEAYMPTTVENIYKAAQGTLAGYPAYGNNGTVYASVAGIFGSPWYYIGYSPTAIPVSADLRALYSAGDIRNEAYFNGPYANDAWPDGTQRPFRNGYFLLFQPEEAYLILAEALYRQDKEPESRNILNEFKAYRNAGSVGASVTGADLLTAIKDERRKEFFFQRDMRWLDLKRYGGVTLKRDLSFFGKLYSVTVPPNDFRYALPIPVSELTQNPSLTGNPGWVQINF